MSTTCQTNDTTYSYTISNLTINTASYSTDPSGNTSVTLNISITYYNSSTETPNSAYLDILPDLTNCSLDYIQYPINVNSGTYTNSSVIFDYDATQNSTLYCYITGGNTSESYMEDGDYVSVALSYATDILTYTVTYATTTSTTGTTTTSLTVSQAPVTSS